MESVHTVLHTKATSKKYVGHTSWAAIAKLLDGRTGLDICDRYRRHLKKHIKCKVAPRTIETVAETKMWKRTADITATPQTSGGHSSADTFETPLAARSRRTIWTKAEDCIVTETKASGDVKDADFDQVTQNANLKRSP